MDTAYVDIETLNFFNDPAIAALPREAQLLALRFGIVVVRGLVRGRNDLVEVYERGQVAAAWQQLCEADLVVGWNIQLFDLPILLREVLIETGGLPPSSGVAPRWPRKTLDLFHEIKQATGRWYKLDQVTVATLGRRKSADGQRAAEWLASGEPELVRQAVDYCREDVDLVAALHQHCQGGAPLELPPLDTKYGADRAYPMRIWIGDQGWERYEVRRAS